MSGKEGQAETIFSSTGKLGPSRRQYDRLYVNGSSYSNNPFVFSENLNRLIRAEERHTQITRSVFRGVVSNDVLSSVLAEDGLREDLEVVVPLHDYRMPNSSLVYFGHNSQDRSPILPKRSMMDGISEQTELVDKSPLEKIIEVSDKGFVFIDSFKEDQIDQLFELWGSTFGWKHAQIGNFLKNLEVSMRVDLSERQYWFSGIEYDGKLIGASMAERRSLSGEGGDLDCVESTEWRISKEYGSNGLMQSTIAMLNAQILSSLGDTPPPFIFAECNIESFAHVTGHRAGFQVPFQGENGSQVPQILVQNVFVGDGAEVKKHYRDFAFMYLTPKSINKYYNSEERAKMMQYLK